MQSVRYVMLGRGERGEGFERRESHDGYPVRKIGDARCVSR